MRGKSEGESEGESEAKYKDTGEGEGEGQGQGRSEARFCGTSGTRSAVQSGAVIVRGFRVEWR